MTALTHAFHLLAAIWLGAAPDAAAVSGVHAEAHAPARAEADSTASAAPAENAFPVTLASFSTTLMGSLPERTDNIRLAAAALDGAVIEPGDLLSFNQVVGPRSRERGYRRAPVILRQVRQLQVGGGVCQVSSTLFVAALLAGLAPIERHRHSSPVDYIPLGEDATISWGVKDLKIRNVLDQRVRLRIEVVGSTLAAHFEGEENPGQTFELQTEEREIPGDPGAGTEPGREIDVFRVRTSAFDDGSREFLHRDRYPPFRPGPG